MGKTITICFTNNKGGSGKSTTCSNLGAAMAQAGKKVLLIDGDMQLNLSLAFFSEDWVLEHATGEKNLYYAIKKQEDLSCYVVHTPYENLDLIPSSTLMSSMNFLQNGRENLFFGNVFRRLKRQELMITF